MEERIGKLEMQVNALIILVRLLVVTTGITVEEAQHAFAKFVSEVKPEDSSGIQRSELEEEFRVLINESFAR